MSSFTEPLKVEVLDKERGGQGLFRVIEPFTYEVGKLGSGETITVEAGYITDFASIPRIAMWLIPIAGRSAKAALLHDWLLHLNDTRATKVFNEALEVAGCPAYRRWIMVAAVFVWTYNDLHGGRRQEMAAVQ